jgi:hypothetical protein
MKISLMFVLKIFLLTVYSLAWGRDYIQESSSRRFHLYLGGGSLPIGMSGNDRYGGRLLREWTTVHYGNPSSSNIDQSKKTEGWALYSNEGELCGAGSYTAGYLTGLKEIEAIVDPYRLRDLRQNCAMSPKNVELFCAKIDALYYRTIALVGVYNQSNPTKPLSVLVDDTSIDDYIFGELSFCINNYMAEKLYSETYILPSCFTTETILSSSGLLSMKCSRYIPELEIFLTAFPSSKAWNIWCQLSGFDRRTANKQFLELIEFPPNTPAVFFSQQGKLMSIAKDCEAWGFVHRLGHLWFDALLLDIHPSVDGKQSSTWEGSETSELIAASIDAYSDACLATGDHSHLVEIIKGLIATRRCPEVVNKVINKYEKFQLKELFLLSQQDIERYMQPAPDYRGKATLVITNQKPINDNKFYTILIQASPKKKQKGWEKYLGWNSKLARWALVDCSGSVLSLGYKLPSKSDLMNILKSNNIYSESAKLEQYLETHPNNEEANLFWALALFYDNFDSIKIQGEAIERIRKISFNSFICSQRSLVKHLFFLKAAIYNKDNSGFQAYCSTLLPSLAASLGQTPSNQQIWEEVFIACWASDGRIYSTPIIQFLYQNDQDPVDTAASQAMLKNVNAAVVRSGLESVLENMEYFWKIIRSKFSLTKTREATADILVHLYARNKNIEAAWSIFNYCKYHGYNEQVCTRMEEYIKINLGPSTATK